MYGYVLKSEAKRWYPNIILMKGKYILVKHIITDEVTGYLFV